jgi:hypothetical protein
MLTHSILNRIGNRNARILSQIIRRFALVQFITLSFISFGQVAFFSIASPSAMNWIYSIHRRPHCLLSFPFFCSQTSPITRSGNFSSQAKAIVAMRTWQDGTILLARYSWLRSSILLSHDNDAIEICETLHNACPANKL